MKQPNFLLLYHQRRFICTVIDSVYNGSKFRLTPSVWPKKHMTPLTFVLWTSFRAKKLQFLTRKTKFPTKPTMLFTEHALPKSIIHPKNIFPTKNYILNQKNKKISTDKLRFPQKLYISHQKNTLSNHSISYQNKILRIRSKDAKNIVPRAKRRVKKKTREMGVSSSTSARKCRLCMDPFRFSYKNYWRSRKNNRKCWLAVYKARTHIQSFNI